MPSRRAFNLFLKGLICIGVFSCSIAVCMGVESSEFEALLQFVRAVDPQDVLKVGQNAPMRQNPCMHKWKGVTCSSHSTSITEIRLENLNLSGILDADSLCKLPNLRIVNLARNQIGGTISKSILHCTRLTYLNLSSNILSGRIPKALTKLKYLRRLDLFNNHFTSTASRFEQGFQPVHTYVKKSRRLQRHGAQKQEKVVDSMAIVTESESLNGGSDSVPRPSTPWYKRYKFMVPLVVGLGFFLLFMYFILKSLRNSPLKMPPPNVQEGEKPLENRSELVFFVEEHESFKLEDLLEATADLRNQSFSSSGLYKVILKNNALYAVKRLKKLQVPFEEFGQTMRQIGIIKHPNILPLVGYNSTNEEKLLIYKFQSNGSLLNLLESYTEGKRDFPWRLRLSIACGISRGLDFIYQGSDDCIPHGNLKLSNILLDENDEPLISEYGLSSFFDPKKGCLISSNGYTAPEKMLSEKGDVYSFGVILLELLTGKTVEGTGIDLPKWVTAMVKEEWTGEVFDKEVAKAAKEWAFPLLNIALKCVSASPTNRPTVEEVYEKIEEVIHDTPNSSDSTTECGGYQDNYCMLHSIILETWDTPGSNY
ncbi:leucine-rich repeat receptor-like protein kinase [Pyrus ussuriensis x Pyrus communis]|uniref:Leucine-rich repeat receptor-like protein kinase n=1 Tax=Pyrus ussuriensis x Pyrus communis TaxID=2448454 RepID=A0A5N5GNV6_9ROSA|nr:leucine-rich repeat receptor-like protein kinase [Pyrus ussuriensis x Pyrus communis]